MKRIVYHVEARLDVLEIVEYYEQEGGVQLPDLFTSELQRFIEAIGQRPESSLVIKEGSFLGHCRIFN